MTESQAKELINRDSEESPVPHGQRVNRTFHLADFFVRSDGQSDRLRGEVRRISEVWFGHPYATPTFDEYAMYFAFSAALRSADLSRQVGAVVAKDNQIIATGANDCPSAGGGLYWPVRRDDGILVEDEPEGRDYLRGYDSNVNQQNCIIDEIVLRGAKPPYGMPQDKLQDLLSNSPIRDLTEYGRVVHAEMEALLACARLGVSTVGADIFCTTFPCHNCAKHIIAAGINRVVYIEPYAKSKALEFHKDAIIFGKRPNDGSKLVLFEPFVGIGPRRYFDLFSMSLGSSYSLDRKDPKSGNKADWNIASARLRIQMKPLSYLDLEKDASSRFSRFLKGESQKQGSETP